MKNQPRIAIILLNWNSAFDTIECLESIFNSNYRNFQVYICDNNSSDNSIEQIIHWASGKSPFSIPVNSPIYKPAIQSIEKPISIKQINKPISYKTIQSDNEFSIFIIKLEENLGFAGGNNIGLSVARKIYPYKYFWFLNNDTVIVPGTLTYLVNRVKEESDIGICGSSIYYYDNPNEIQAYGGNTYNKWIARSSYINKIDPNPPEGSFTAYVEKKMDMVLGVSMFVSSEFIDKVGPLYDGYFLFSEEIDWATRGKGHFSLGFAKKSHLFHKKGRATGSTKDPKSRSASTDYYNIRSRILFTKRHYSYALPTVLLSLVGVLLNRFRRGQFDRLPLILQILKETLISPNRTTNRHKIS